MSTTQNFKVELTEKEIISVEIKEIDVLDYYEKNIISNLKVETPTKLSATKFQTSEAFVPGLLLVFLNGLKEQFITEVTSTTFEFEISTIDTDTVEACYVEAS